MKPLKLWKRMALRGKLLSVLILLIFLSLIIWAGISIYNIPSLVQNRAIQSVNTLFTQNDESLADGVTLNTGLISQAQKEVNSIEDESLRQYLLTRINTAQKMADTVNGIQSLYTKNEDGTRSVVKTINPFQVENINKNLSELDALGKTKFTETLKQDFAQAYGQYDIYKQFNDLLDSLYTDGSARTQLKEDASSEICDQAEHLINQLENADLKSDLTFTLSQIKQKVEAQEALMEAQRKAEEEAREAQRKAEEEAAKAEKEKNNPGKKIQDAVNNAIDSLKPQP